MKLAELSSTLEVVGVQCKQATMTWGPPGVGKSRVHEQTADRCFGVRLGTQRKQLNKAVKVAMANGKPYFIDCRLPLFDAVDLRGIPMERNERTAWLTPSFLPTEGEGMLFLDELPQAMPIVQSAASQLILDRRIGEYTLPDGWVICAAGNREEDRAATHKMPSHIANRFVHLHVQVDYDDWAAWASVSNVNPMVIAFLGFRPELLHKFDKNAKSFPTPRTWEFVSSMLPKLPDDPKLMLEIITGTVGEDAAKQFVGFVRVFRDLPDFDEIVKRPDDAKVPEHNAAAAYATGTMLAARTEAKHMKAVFRYLHRMPEEYEVMTVRQMVKANKDLASTPTYIQWMADHQNVLLNKAA